MTEYLLYRRELLIGLAGVGSLAGCGLDRVAKETGRDIRAFTGRTYDSFLGAFFDETKAVYVAHHDGAKITYQNEDGSSVVIVDGLEERLTGISGTARKAGRALLSLISEPAIYDGKTVDLAIITNTQGRTATFNQNNGSRELVAANEDLRRFTSEVLQYMNLFLLAVRYGEVTYVGKDAQQHDQYAILANLGRIIITAKDSTGEGLTDYFKVEKDGSTIIEITGTPEIFEEVQPNLVNTARMALGNEASGSVIKKRTGFSN